MLFKQVSDEMMMMVMMMIVMMIVMYMMMMMMMMIVMCNGCDDDFDVYDDGNFNIKYAIYYIYLPQFMDSTIRCSSNHGSWTCYSW
jgi:hypothetical protein